MPVEVDGLVLEPQTERISLLEPAFTDLLAQWARCADEAEA